jgi:hypothetical protein
MKRRTFLKEGSLFAAGLASSPAAFARLNGGRFLNREGQAPSRAAKEVPLLVLEGPARKRGQVHGETLRPKIKEAIARWKDFLGTSRRGQPDKYIDRFLGETGFLPAIKRWTPDLLEETEGLGEGSGVDFKTIYAFQLMDEEWLFGRKTALEGAETGAARCSALGAFDQDDYPALQAQTMDIPGYADGFQVLLRVKHRDSSLESLVFTYAGLIVLNGLNNVPIGLCCNTLDQLNYSTDGLPVAFFNRGILGQRTLEDAVEFARKVKHASGQNYIIGGKEKINDFECSANKVIPFVPFPGAARVYHTNHPLVNDDQGIYRELQKKMTASGKDPGPSNSEIRFESLEKRLKDTSKKVTVETAREILSSHDDPRHPVCRHKRPDGGSMTIGCSIMVLSSPPELHFAPGPPCLTEFRTYNFLS